MLALMPRLLSLALALSFLSLLPADAQSDRIVEFEDLHVGRTPEGQIGVSYRLASASWQRIRSQSPVIRTIVTPQSGNPVRAHVPLQAGGIFALPATDGNIHVYIEVGGQTAPFRIANEAGPFTSVEADARFLQPLPHQGVHAPR